MLVEVHEREYALYIDVSGKWVMHTYDLHRESPRWICTDYDVSDVNPFRSAVAYDAWR